MKKTSRASVTVESVLIPNPELHLEGLSKSAIKADLSGRFKLAYQAAESALGRALSDEDKMVLRNRVMATRDARYLADGFHYSSDKTDVRLRKGKTDQFQRTVRMERELRTGEECFALEKAWRNMGTARVAMEKAFLEPKGPNAPFQAWERLTKAADMLVAKVDQYGDAVPAAFKVRAAKLLYPVEEWKRVASQSAPAGETPSPWPKFPSVAELTSMQFADTPRELEATPPASTVTEA